MAYLQKDLLKDEDLNTAGDQIANKSSAASTAGDAGFGLSGIATPDAKSSMTAGKPTTSGSFVDIQRYLGANKDQTDALGNKVAGQYNSAADKANNTLLNAQDTVFDKVKSGTNNYDDSLLNQAWSDPTKADAGAIARMKSGTYAGPNSADEAGVTGQINADVGAVKNLRDLNGTEGGRMEVIRNLVNAPKQQAPLSHGQAMNGVTQADLDAQAAATQSPQNPYALGSNKLDQFLLQNTDSARNTIQGAVDHTKVVDDLQTQTNDKFNDFINSGKSTSAQTGQKTTQRLNDFVNADQQNLLGDVNSAKQKAATQAAEAKWWLDNANTVPNDAAGKNDPNTISQVGQGPLSYRTQAYINQGMDPDTAAKRANAELDAALQSVGMDRATYDSFAANNQEAMSAGSKGINVGSYLTVNDPNAIYSVANTATPEQQARYRALAQMAGIDPNTMLSGPTTRDSAMSFDRAKADNDLRVMIDTANANRTAQQQAQDNAKMQANASSQGSSDSSSSTMIAGIAGAAAMFFAF
jgi:hypothetical protein